MLRPTRFGHPDRTVIYAVYLILAQLKQKRLVGCKQLLTISGSPTLVKQDVKVFSPKALRERECALAVAADRTK